MMIKVTMEFANVAELLAHFPRPAEKQAPAPVAQAPAPAVKVAVEPVAQVVTPVVVAEPAAPTITYPDLQKVVTKLASVDKAAAVAICKGLGADNFKLLKPEQWQEAHDLTVAALAKVA